MIQVLLNSLIRHPISNLKRWNRFGGYFTYHKMISESKKMTRAAFKLPSVRSHDSGLPVYFLTGKNYLYQTLFCIQSLSKVSDAKFQFLLVDDGTFDQLIIEQIKRQLPGAAIITKEMIEENLEDALPKSIYPNLHRKRKEYPHIKKLTDIHTIPGNDWKLVLDSDMLFWKNPSELIAWLEDPQLPTHMIDCNQSYGYSVALMKELCGDSILNLLNVGVIGLNSSTINWEALDYWVSILEEKEGGSYYLEQALTAMLIGSKSTTILNTDDYKVNPNNFDDSKEILHHYVDLSKKVYFKHAWKKVIG